MDNYIVGLIEQMILGTQNLASDTSILTQTPEAFNISIYNGVMSISQSAVMPIGYIILALIFVLELQSITTRTDNQGTMGFEIPFKLMFKFVLCKLAVDSTPLILGAIFQVSNEVIFGIGNVFSSSNPNIPAQLNTMKDTINNMDFGVKLMTATQISLIWLIYKFSTLIINIIIIGRMIEIYVMMAIAAIPIATIGHSEMGSIGKNFLKSFAAVCMQGALIYIILSMYGSLVSGISTSFNPSDITSVLWEVLLYTLVLVMAIFSTSRISKSVLNAM
jgi:hypothetical protein